MKELEKLFPQHFGTENSANLRKYKVVKTPRSVYTAIPGRQAYRPDQTTPVPNFFLAGSYTMQRYLGSMEGAVLSGKLTAQAIVRSQQLTDASRPISPSDQLQANLTGAKV